MQHVCPKCAGPTYPRTAPVGNTAVHDRTCRNCGLIYTFDPNADAVASGRDLHLKALEETKKKGEKGKK
jgi:hypothetical protein